jgi:hypothetical protein
MDCIYIFQPGILLLNMEIYLLNYSRYNMLCFLEGIEAYTLAPLTRVLGMDVEEVRDLLAKSHADIRNKKLRIYFWL